MFRVILFLIALLCVLLPVQTIIAQFSTNILNFPIWVSFWKEVVVALVGLFFLWEILTLSIKHKASSIMIAKLNWPLVLFLCATTLIVLSSLIQNIPFNFIIFGFRFDLWWLGFFALSVSWVKTLKEYNEKVQEKFDSMGKTLSRSSLVGFGLTAIVSLLSVFLGQSTVLNILGFGQNEGGVDFLTIAPLGHVIDFGENGYRLSGGFSTPNHFAGYLLLILPILATSCYHNILRKNTSKASVAAGLLLLCCGLIILSFARFAYLGLLTFSLFSIVLYLLSTSSKITPNKFNDRFYKIILSAILALPIFIGVLAINLNPSYLQSLPTFLAKPSSTIEHYRRTMASLNVLEQDPSKMIFGFGLGTAGPAAKPEYSNYTENPIFVNHSSLAYDWGLVGEDLFIPENWFIQLVLSGGVIYTALYLMIVTYPLKRLVSLIKNLNLQQLKSDLSETDWVQVWSSLALFNIIIGNLFLHIWENQTIAIFWTLLWIWQASFESAIASRNTKKDSVLVDSSLE